MTDTLSPEQTAAFRKNQKSRSRVIFLIAILWVAGLFALTMVKGHMAEDQRMQKAHDAK